MKTSNPQVPKDRHEKVRRLAIKNKRLVPAQYAIVIDAGLKALKEREVQ